MEKQQPITVKTTIAAPLTKVWQYWNQPEHVMQWAFASDDWEAPAATNDLRVGGQFSTTMAAKDKSTSFDFTGTYVVVENESVIEYDMPNGRHVKVEFIQVPEGVQVIETFDPEGTHSREMQQAGWQSILNNFKKHVENA